MKILEKYNTIVTGGSDGIGKAIALEFARNGSNVWVISRKADKMKILLQQLETFQVNVQHSIADLSDAVQLEKTAELIGEHWDSIHVLVNNAGTAKFKPLIEDPQSEYQVHFDLNVRAPILLTSYLHHQLKSGKGCVINISSYLAERMYLDLSTTIYSASKGAINSFTRALAAEWGPDVRVNAIAPGTVQTNLVQSNISRMSEEERLKFFAKIEENYPMKVLGQAESIAQMAVYLASPQASWTTGAIFPVDGGLTIT